MEVVMTGVTPSVGENAEDKDPKDVSVVFNKQTIEIPKGDYTGAEIKAAAIAGGVKIEPNFPLAVKHGNRFENVGDTDVVHVHANMEFTAVPGDDNS
jgi:hypothetical protein